MKSIPVSYKTMNNIQDTSLAAWTAMQDKLGFKQKQVLEIIRSYPGRTNNEIAALLRLPINRITGRTNELVKMGLVEDAGKKRDPFTGKTAYVWRAKHPPFPEA